MERSTTKLSTKISLLVTMSCLAVTAVLIGFVVYNYASFAHERVADFRQKLFADYDVTIKFQVESANSMLKALHEKSVKGEMTLDQAKKTGADLLRDLRYGKDGYFWADTADGTNVVHATVRSFEGKNRIELKDHKNNYFMKDIIGNGRKDGGGYSDYWFAKAGGGDPFLKRAYSLEFKPWGWIVGTGNYIDDIEKIVGEAETVYRNEIRKNIISLALLALITLGCALTFGVLMTRKLLAQLGGEPAVISDIAHRIANGDLTVQFSSNASEVGIMAAMREMTERLRGILAELKSSSDAVSHGSVELSDNSNHISAQMTSQAERAAQIAASATEMSQTVIDIARNASGIANSASDTAHIAQKGSTIVGKTVAESREISSTVNESSRIMASLGDRSKQIGEIVSVINDIADQTNLLALNAAIEAARAGEQGRGFAVVADEVRKLAERTANATAEISEMIRSIQDEVDDAVAAMGKTTTRVEAGVENSLQAGSSLEEIVRSVSDLQSMVQQIASATEEMSSVSEHISGDIEGVASLAKDTSSGAERIARSSSQLSQLATRLQAIVSQFKV